MKKCKFAAAVLFCFLLSSCFGINADIVLNQNGSGEITLEYKIARSLDLLGRLDGNERWMTIPVGRADFERTIDRLPEMKLVSFSSKEDERDVNVLVKMEFSSIEGLLAFLDARGERSSFSKEDSRLTFILSEGRKNVAPGNRMLLDWIDPEIFRGYEVNFSMAFPGDGTLEVMNSQGMPSAVGNRIVRQGRAVSSSFPLHEILSSEEGIALEFKW